MKKTVFVATAALVAGVHAAIAGAAGTISVPVSGIKNEEGVVRCGLYSSAATFRQPGAEMKGSVAKISGGSATCSFSGVPAGTYAVAVFHAENNETEIQLGMFGKPKQGYGFSKNAGGALSPPSFDDAAVAFDGTKASWPTIRLRY